MLRFLTTPLMRRTVDGSHRSWSTIDTLCVRPCTMCVEQVTLCGLICNAKSEEMNKTTNVRNREPRRDVRYQGGMRGRPRPSQ